MWEIWALLTSYLGVSHVSHTARLLFLLELLTHTYLRNKPQTQLSWNIIKTQLIAMCSHGHKLKCGFQKLFFSNLEYQQRESGEGVHPSDSRHREINMCCDCSNSRPQWVMAETWCIQEQELQCWKWKTSFLKNEVAHIEILQLRPSGVILGTKGKDKLKRTDGENCSPSS